MSVLNMVDLYVSYNDLIYLNILCYAPVFLSIDAANKIHVQLLPRLPFCRLYSYGA